MATFLQIHEPGKTPSPHEGEEKISIGIDLGTTNSVVVANSNKGSEVLRDERGKALIPSTVAYKTDGSLLVGDLASELLLDQPESVVGSIKRLMGRGVGDIKSVSGVIPFDVEPGSDGEFGMVRINVGGKKLTPVEISADILRILRQRAEEYLGQSVNKAVITVPAYFDDSARTATKDAAKLAGLNVLRLVNEPTAAALAYGLDESAEGVYAVYDLGGGTFDISILRMEKGVFQVLATGGDAALGGDDFDQVIAELFLSEREEKKLTSNNVKLALLTARNAKEHLSEFNEGEWVLDLDEISSIHKLNRSTFDTLINELVTRTTKICRDVIEEADVTTEDINGIVLVGGSTRVPLVRKKVTQFFGKEPLSNINPDEVVALGAALQAEALTIGSENLLLDVTPLSLGIETMGGLVEKIIHRNTPIPVAKAQEFTTYIDGQTAMVLHVVQGEREIVDDNRSLARFELKEIPPMTAGAARIRVTFAVDADGLLTVSAIEDTTGAEAKVAVKPTYGINDDEMAKMLFESMKHAKKDIELRLLAEARVEAGRDLHAVNAALSIDGDLLTETQFGEIQTVITQLEKSMKTDDRELINALAEKLEKATKSFAELRMDRGIRSALRGVDLAVLDEQSSKG